MSIKESLRKFLKRENKKFALLISQNQYDSITNLINLQYEGKNSQFAALFGYIDSEENVLRAESIKVFPYGDNPIGEEQIASTQAHVASFQHIMQEKNADFIATLSIHPSKFGNTMSFEEEKKFKKISEYFYECGNNITVINGIATDKGIVFYLYDRSTGSFKIIPCRVDEHFLKTPNIVDERIR